MNKYEFDAVLWKESTDSPVHVTIQVEAKSTVGAWLKALYDAMKIINDDQFLVELNYVYG